MPAIAQDADWRVVAVAADQASGLAINHLKVCAEAPYFGACVDHPEAWKRNETLHLYLEPSGLRRQTGPWGYRLKFSEDLILRDADGAELWRRDGMLRVVRETQQPMLDIYAVNRIDLSGMPAGKYQVQVIVHDEISGQQADARLAFAVGARSGAKPSPDLAPERRGK